MKYLKLFDTESAYKAYRDGGGYIKPNVSLSIDTEEVHYNYPRWNTNDKPFVDLDLPSGTLWATCNVGASKPTDYGLYFQWGDTVGYRADQVGTGDGQKKFSWADYKWRLSGDSYDNIAFTKYTDAGATLELADDAANANMGGDWHMPTPEQIRELLDNTTNTWTEQNYVKGRWFTSKNGNSIFIPAAGYAWDGSLYNSGNGGYVWSSMLYTYNVSGGQYLNFSSGNVSLSYYDGRSNGFSVRGVLG